MATATNRSIYNPIQHNQVTFVNTSDETRGQRLAHTTRRRDLEAESMARYVPPI